MLLIILLVACGTTNNPARNIDSGVDNSTSTDSTDISFTQDETFLGYTIYCPEKSAVSNSKYGKAFSYGSDFSVIVEAPAAVGSVFTVKGFDDIVDSCEEYVCASLESRNIDIFNTDSTEQKVIEEKELKINGLDMLRVIGVFKNTRDNTEIEYVAYYLLATADSGISYPVYIVGIPLNDSTTALGEFMDEMVSHIKK